MSCEELSDLLCACVDGELSVAQNLALREHCELCARCAALLARERELRALIEAAGRESSARSAEAWAAALVEGAAARLEAEGVEEADPRASPGRRGLVRGAAAALLAAGLAFALSPSSNPLCVRGCPTLSLAVAARAAEGEPTLSLIELQAAFPPPLFVPAFCGLTVEGGQLVSAAGAPPRPLLRLRCQRSGQRAALLHVPAGHSHLWRRRTLPDGRDYLEARTPEGLHLVGWPARGGVYVCLAEVEVREGALFALAAAVRDAAT